jgi:hypothetical protein
MKHIVDGHEYRTDLGREHMDLFNNYGSLVAVGTLSPCSEYWHFETCEGVDCGASDSYHVNNLEGFTVEQQLARWYSVAGQ